MIKSPETSFGGEEKNPKDLLIKSVDHPEIDEQEIKKNINENGNFGWIQTNDTGIIVDIILSTPEQEKKIELGKKLIDDCIEAQIVEPSTWNEKLEYPKSGHEDGFSFKWVNHYHKNMVLRYEGWDIVSQNLHVLTKEVPELRQYAEKMLEEKEE